MDQAIRPKPEKPRISHDVEGYFDENGQWQRFLRVTFNGCRVAVVKTMTEAFEYATTYGATA